jgi:hypothetical protein
VDVRLVPAGPPGGGARISPSRPARARLITAGGSLAAFAGAAADAATTGGHLADLAVALEGAALLFVAAAVVLRWQVLIPWAVLASGGGYLVGREGHAVVDGRSAGVGVLLLLGAELATWSIEHDGRIRAERAVIVRRALTLACLAAAALVVDLALLGTASLPGGGGVLVAAAGVAAAVAAIGFVVRLIRTG